MAKGDPAAARLKAAGLAAITAKAGAAAPAGSRSLAQWLQPLCRAELLLPALLVFCLSLPVFSRLVAGMDPKSPHSDHLMHVALAEQLALKREYPPHPLFHIGVAVLSFGHNPYAMAGMAAVLLAWAFGARAYLSAYRFTDGNAPPLGVVVALCLALAVVMPLPNWWSHTSYLVNETRQYLKDMPSPDWWDLPAVAQGQIPTNVWYNPTGIFVMPFNFLLFLLGLRALARPRWSVLAAMGGVTVFGLLAKPNYFLAFAPCFGVALLVAFTRAIRAGRMTVPDAAARAGAVFGPAVVVLLFQYASAFGGANADNRVAFAPLVAWSKLTPNIPASILLSIAFPLTVTVLYWRAAVRDPASLLAWAVLIVAVLQYALLAESGKRADYNNFGWGAVAANQVLFLVGCDFLLRQPPGVLRKVAFACLGLHVASGCVVLARCLFSPSMANAF